MKIKNEKEVLQAFCDNDTKLRPVLNSPFFCEPTGEVRASDGHIMLMVDPKLLRCKYAASDISDKIIIPRQNSNTIVKLDECECPACKGEGTVQWGFTAPGRKTYYMDDDCPVCDGTGKVAECREVPTGRMILPKDAMFVIDGAHFSAYYMMKAVNGLRLLGCKELRHIYTSKNVYNLFAVQDGIRLLVMPGIVYGTMEDVKTTKED